MDKWYIFKGETNLVWLVEDSWSCIIILCMKDVKLCIWSHRGVQTNKQTDRQYKREQRPLPFQTDLFNYLPYSMDVNNSCDHFWVLTVPYSPINNVQKQINVYQFRKRKVTLFHENLKALFLWGGAEGNISEASKDINFTSFARDQSLSGLLYSQWRTGFYVFANFIKIVTQQVINIRGV